MERGRRQRRQRMTNASCFRASARALLLLILQRYLTYSYDVHRTLLEIALKTPVAFQQSGQTSSYAQQQNHLSGEHSLRIISISKQNVIYIAFLSTYLPMYPRNACCRLP
jgi:hypothetical protein